MRRSVILMILVAGLAGCAGTEETQATATVEFDFVDDADAPVDFEFSGAWIKEVGTNGSWARVVDQGTVFTLGNGSVLGAGVPVGVYDRARLVFDAVHVDGTARTMVESGFELPLNLTLPQSTVTRVTFGLAWTDALFDAAEGPAFLPVLHSVNVTRDGEGLYGLEAEEIQTAPTKSPVARIEAFDAKGLRFFESDFIAESPKKYVLAAGPNLTFQASSSEAVEKGATLDRFLWDFGDGTTGEGGSVEHAYPLEGGKFKVRLTVVDSNGVEDSQTLKIGIQPGTTKASQESSVTVTGVYPTSCSTSDRGSGGDSVTFTVDAATTPAGDAADLVRVKARGYVVGNPHAGADIDIRLLDPDGKSVGTGTSSGTSESVSTTYAAGNAPDGDWTVEVKPCSAYDLEYAVVLESTWEGRASDSFAAWLAEYDDGHEHKH